MMIKSCIEKYTLAVPINQTTICMVNRTVICLFFVIVDNLQDSKDHLVKKSNQYGIETGSIEQ